MVRAGIALTSGAYRVSVVASVIGEVSRLGCWIVGAPRPARRNKCQGK